MGKHKNKTQIDIFVQFMENNPDIAKGFTKKDKPLVESLWQKLSESLNSVGPPNKDTNGWKKVWTDWKSEVKKKLAHNKIEERATGGGPFSKHVLSSTEEAIVRICSMAQSVEGVPGIAPGVNDSAYEIDDGIPSTSSKRPRNIYPAVASTPKKPRAESANDRLNRFLCENNEMAKDVHKTLAEIAITQKENASSLRRAYHAIENGNKAIAQAVSELKEEVSSISSRILQAMQEHNEIKRKEVDLQLLKFEYEKDRTF